MSKGVEANKSGWLIREESDDGVISWKRRWSCVEDGYLIFYKKQNKKQMLDKVDLRAAAKIVPATYKNKKHCWQIQAPDRTTSLLASSESEMALWIKAAFMSKVAAGQSGTPRSAPIPLSSSPQTTPGIVLTGTPEHSSNDGRRNTMSFSSGSSSGGAPPPPPPPPGPGAYKQSRPPTAMQPTSAPRPNPMGQAAEPNGTPASPPTGMMGGFMAELSAALGGGRQSLRPTMTPVRIIFHVWQLFLSVLFYVIFSNCMNVREEIQRVPTKHLPTINHCQLVTRVHRAICP